VVSDYHTRSDEYAAIRQDLLAIEASIQIAQESGSAIVCPSLVI